ncbi:ParB/RepB/Spo0J family partition protein [Streptosporangium sp. OZ121]|uniref:ParB/RepB/Spo0J family partition protein n=1 Tax=Streptosporangium sp. OZ121 TaxID=3444183 RepID=UPI003F7B295E
MPRGKAGATKQGRPTDAPRPTAALSIQASLVVVEGTRFPAKLSRIAPSPRNVREEWEWEAEDFKQFSRNVRSVGQIQDGVVCTIARYLETWPEDADRFGEQLEKIDFVLIAGERRYRSHLANGDEEMTVVLRDSILSRGDFAFLSENQHRANFSPLQEGKLYARIMSERGMSYAEIAAELGEAPENVASNKTKISKRVRLYKDFPPGPDTPPGPARMAIHRGELGVEPAYYLLTQLGDNPELIEQAYATMRANGLSAQQVVKRLTDVTADEPSPQAAVPARVEDAEEAENAPQSRTPGESTSPPAALDDGVSSTKHLDAEGRGEPEHTLTTPPVSSLSPAKRSGASADAVSPAKRRRVRQETAARLSAGQRLIAARSYKAPDEITGRLATALISSVSAQYLTVAISLAGFDAHESSAASPASRTAYLESLSSGDDPSSLVRIADAVALVVVEMRLRADSPETWAEPQAAYLRELVHHAGYEPTPEEAAFLRAQPTQPDSPRSEQ